MLISRPGVKATNPLDPSLPTEAYLVLSFIDCRLLLLFTVTNDSANVGLYNDRGASFCYSMYCTRIVTNAKILFRTGEIVRCVYIIFRLSLIFCCFLIPLISVYTSVSRVSFHLFIRCLLLSFCRCNVQGTLTGTVISQIICLC